MMHGVTRGSILGPLLFISYINDMPNNNINFKFVLYADDTNIIETGKSVGDVLSKMNEYELRVLPCISKLGRYK